MTQEMLREIKRVVEVTSRIDERVKNISDSYAKIAERFDRFLDQHNNLVERVNKIENTTWTGSKIEDRLNDINETHNNLNIRIASVENHIPYSLKIVDQSLKALNNLEERISKVEKESTQIKGLAGWFGWILEWVFKVSLIIVVAYILALLGLGGVNMPAPF